MVFVWCDRIGLILQFLAGFLIAPELLGPQGLERFRKAIGLGVQLSIYIPMGLGISLLMGIFAFRQLEKHLHGFIIAAIVVSIALALLFVGMRLVHRRVLATLIEELEDDERLRRRLLGIAGLFFTLGFLFQFLGTYG